MPLVRIAMKKGKTPEYKKTILDCVHNGLVDALGIENWDRFQRIDEYDEDCFEMPSFKTDSFMIIEIIMFPGRTKEQKKDLIEKITGNLVRELSVDSGDVFVVINEPANDNWGMGGHQKE